MSKGGSSGARTTLMKNVTTKNYLDKISCNNTLYLQEIMMHTGAQSNM